MSRGYDDRDDRRDTRRDYDEPRGGYRDDRDRYDDRDDRGRRGANIAGRRPGSRHGIRRKEWGSWDGNPESIPGRTNSDDTPDMRDPVNREAFLGENINTRRNIALQNLRGGGRREDDRDYRREDDRDYRRDEPRGGSSRREDQPRSRRGQDLVQISPRDLEDMNDDELIAVGEQINNIEYHLLREMKHRERSSGAASGGGGGRSAGMQRDEPRGRDYEDAGPEERERRREQYADDPNVPRNQDNTPDLRTREAGGGRQGQGRVTDPRDDDRLVENRDQGRNAGDYGRGRDYDDRGREPMRSRRD